MGVAVHEYVHEYTNGGRRIWLLLIISVDGRSGKGELVGVAVHEYVHEYTNGGRRIWSLLMISVDGRSGEGKLVGVAVHEYVHEYTNGGLLFVHSWSHSWMAHSWMVFLALSRPIRWTGFMSLPGKTRRYSSLLRPKLKSKPTGALVAFK